MPSDTNTIKLTTAFIGVFRVGCRFANSLGKNPSLPATHMSLALVYMEPVGL